MLHKISIRDMWVIFAGYLAAIHVGKLAAVIPVLQQELNLSLTQAGLSLSLVQGAGMLFALFIGAFSEKMGLKRCLVGALIVLGLSSLTGPWVDRASLLYLFRFTEGLGFLTISLCAPAILKRISAPEHLNFKMGFWSSYMGVGVSLAVLTIPMLLKWLSWQQIWVILGGLCLIIALMIHLFLQLDAPPAQSNNTANVTNTAESGFWNIVKITATHPPILCLAVIFACYSSQWITVTGFLPSMYVEQGLSLQTAGMLVSIVVLANLGGTFGAGTLLNRGFDPKALIRAGFIGMLVCSILSFSLRDWLAFEIQFISAILFSMIGGMIPTTMFSITLKHAPRANAAAASVGLVLQCSAFAQFLLPPLSASIISATQQWSMIALMTGSLCIVGILMNNLLFKRYST